MPSWFAAWRRDVRGRRSIRPYVSYLMRDPEPGDVDWLAEVATAGDTDRATWELRYARRALGLIVAQRDALDDRTASLAARELDAAMRADRNVAAERVSLAGRQLADRLGAYRDMLQLRGTSQSAGERLGRALLMLAGAPRVSADALLRAATVLEDYVAGSNRALRLAVGEASLPQDVRPSALEP